MDLNNKYQARLFVVIVSILTILLAVIAFNKNKGFKKKEFYWSFKGVVEKVHYTYQGIPYVTVNGKEYNLNGANTTLDYKIKKGDTIIKQKGDIRIKIIRPNSRDTIYDRNPIYDPSYKGN